MSRMIPTATRGNHWIFVFLLSCFWLASFAPAQSQQFRINKGCPAMGDPALRTMTQEEMTCRCFNIGSCSGSSPSTNAAPENGAVLNCGQHRAMAIKALNDPSFIEGVNSQAVVADHCPPGTDNSTIPGDSDASGIFLSGPYRYERGYFTSFQGRKGRTCRTYYDGTAYLNRGTIEFVSGGHTWRGTIAQNSYISITRDGITPRPKNHTTIYGSLYDANMYNGYCGSGYFKLYPQ